MKILKVLPEVNDDPIGAKSWVGVMITIFCDFCRFSAKKLAFFIKTNNMIKFCLVLSQKTPFFAIFFRENIFKNCCLKPC
jgi:hypothetical protein